MQFNKNITWVEIKTLLWLSFELNNISSSHSLLQMEIQISWSYCDFLSITHRTSLLWTKSCSPTLLTFHIHLFHCIFHLHLSCHFSCSTTCLTFLFNTTLISCTFTVFAYLSPSKTIDFITSSVEFLERNPHLCSEITSFSKGSLLELFQTLLSM